MVHGYITVSQVKNMTEVYYVIWGKNVGIPIVVVV